MEIEQSSLWNEVEQVIRQTSANPVHWLYQAQIHANNVNYPVFKVIEVNTLRDYESEYSDHMTIDCQILQGMFYSSIYPYMDALEMTLYKYPVQAVSDSLSDTQALETERFVATHQPMPGQSGGSPFMSQNGMNAVSEQGLNLSDLPTFRFQLQNKALVQMRMGQVGNIIRGATTDQAIRAVLTQATQNIKVDAARAIKGVTMVKGHNQVKRDHIVIPQGIDILDVPQYIHEKCGGVYASGFGYYLQNSYWHVYPCYDPTRFGTAPVTITIINIPKNKLPHIELTYRQSGNNIVILATGEVKFSDKTNAAQLNHGNGARWADATNFIANIATPIKNRVSMARATLNSEIVSVKRATGLNNVKRSSNPITANPYHEYSKLAARQGSTFGLVWHNSDPSLITPGVPVQIMYLDGETVVTTQGVILKAGHSARNTATGASDSRHQTDTMLSVFTQRPVGNGDPGGTSTVIQA